LRRFVLQGRPEVPGGRSSSAMSPSTVACAKGRRCRALASRSPGDDSPVHSADDTAVASGEREKSKADRICSRTKTRRGSHLSDCSRRIAHTPPVSEFTVTRRGSLSRIPGWFIRARRSCRYSRSSAALSLFSTRARSRLWSRSSASSTLSYSAHRRRT
jgi:hypothetical protein